MASGLVVLSWPLQKEEKVLFIQDSSNINSRIGTDWLWLLWPVLPDIPELRTHWLNLFLPLELMFLGPTAVEKGRKRELSRGKQHFFFSQKKKMLGCWMGPNRAECPLLTLLIT